MLKPLVFVFKELGEIEYQGEYQHNTTIDGCALTGHVLLKAKCYSVNDALLCGKYLDSTKPHVSFETHDDGGIH